jgi:hypothetical protein
MGTIPMRGGGRAAGGILRKPWVIALVAATGINLGAAGLYSQSLGVAPRPSELEKSLLEDRQRLGRLLQSDRSEFGEALSGDRAALEAILLDHRTQLEAALQRIQKTAAAPPVDASQAKDRLQRWVFGILTFVFASLAVVFFLRAAISLGQFWLNKSSPAEVASAAITALFSTILSVQSWVSFDHVEVFGRLDALVKFDFETAKNDDDLRKDLMTKLAALDEQLTRLEGALAVESDIGEKLADLQEKLADETTRQGEFRADMQLRVNRIETNIVSLKYQSREVAVDGSRGLIALSEDTTALLSTLGEVSRLLHRAPSASDAPGPTVEIAFNPHTVPLLGSPFEAYCGGGNNQIIQAFKIKEHDVIDGPVNDFFEQVRSVATFIKRWGGGKEPVGLVFIGSADRRTYPNNGELAQRRAEAVRDAMMASFGSRPMTITLNNASSGIRLLKSETPFDALRAVQVCALWGRDGPQHDWSIAGAR